MATISNKPDIHDFNSAEMHWIETHPELISREHIGEFSIFEIQICKLEEVLENFKNLLSDIDRTTI